MKGGRLVCLLLAILLSFSMSGVAFASEDWDEQARELGIGEDLAAIEEFLKENLNTPEQAGLSFGELIQLLLAGDLRAILQKVGYFLANALGAEVAFGSRLLLQVAVIGIFGAVFGNFSCAFSGGNVSEAGFFVTYLLLFSYLGASFFSSLSIAQTVLEQGLSFLKLLMPAYFMAAAFAGGSLSAAALYEAMSAGAALIQWLCGGILLEAVKVDALLVLAGHITREELLEKLRELLEQGVSWSLKTLVGLVLGMQLLTGLVTPYADSAKQAGVRKVFEMIPGIGQGAGALAQLVLGSGVLVKNSIGAAGVLVLVVIALIPVLKLLLLMVSCQLAAALMQPVCDRRIVSCVSGIAKAHALLLWVVLTALLIQVLSIALTCAATNVNYYTV